MNQHLTDRLRDRPRCPILRLRRWCPHAKALAVPAALDPVRGHERMSATGMMHRPSPEVGPAVRFRAEAGREPATMTDVFLTVTGTDPRGMP